MSDPLPSATPVLANRPTKVVVISHSPFFYWWPVWAVGFLMAVLTYFFGHQVAFIPPGGTAASASIDLNQPQLRMTMSNNFGMTWALTLCLVIVLTFAQSRKTRSVITIIVLVVLAILIALLGLWDPIFRALQFFEIHITGYGYFSISLLLLVTWLLMYLLYDRQMRMVFTPEQVRVRTRIGGGESVHDIQTLVIEKHQDDLLRHWLLGFGSGDLIVNTTGANPVKYEWLNVFWINRKLAQINAMILQPQVVKAK
jgi:hypothetical protein